MRILIVSGFFYPQLTPRAFRTTELVKRFCELGHDVSVYFPKCDNDYSAFISKYPVRIIQYPKIVEKRRFVGIPIIDRIVFRILNQFFNYPDGRNIKPLFRLLKHEAGYDLLITIAMPHSVHWAMGKVYEKGNKVADCWVADCGDPFMLAETGSFRPPFYFKHLETRWCRQCNYISVPTKQSLGGYYPVFRNKIQVIPQGFDYSGIKRKEYVRHTIPTMAYSGSLIPGKRDLRLILDVLIKNNADFVFHVYTSQKELFEPYKNLLGCKLHLHDYIPREELIEELSRMDFLVNLDNGITVQTPSKLIDYALTGRPILSLNSNCINVDRLESFLKGDFSEQFVVEDIEQYDIRIVAQQFLNLCK